MAVDSSTEFWVITVVTSNFNNLPRTFRHEDNRKAFPTWLNLHATCGSTFHEGKNAQRCTLSKPEKNQNKQNHSKQKKSVWGTCVRDLEVNVKNPLDVILNVSVRVQSQDRNSIILPLLVPAPGADPTDDTQTQAPWCSRGWSLKAGRRERSAHPSCSLPTLVPSLWQQQYPQPWLSRLDLFLQLPAFSGLQSHWFLLCPHSYGDGNGS